METAGSEQQVREIIERLVDAWNRAEMDAFVSLFTADATYVSGAGVLLKGTQAIRDGLSNLEGSSGERDIVVLKDALVNLVKPEVAVVHSTWEMPVRRTDERLSPRKGIFTAVVTRDREGWRIAALQNTDRME